MNEDDFFSDMMGMFGNGIEDKFPSRLHYKIAKQYGESDVEDVRTRRLNSPFSGNMNPLTAIEMVYAVLPLYELGLGLVLDSLTGMKEDLGNGVDVKVDDKKRKVPETLEVKAEGVGRQISIFEKLKDLKGILEESVDLTVKRYTQLADYAMINAESRNLRVISESLERQEFKDSVTRLAYGSYDEACAEIGKFVDLMKKMDDFFRQVRKEALSIPGLEELASAVKLKNKRPNYDRKFASVKKELKRIFSEQEEC